MSDNTPQPQADDNVLSVGLRKLADTIVHFVYPYGNEATFYGYNPDEPVIDADGNEISYTIPTSNAINELKSTSIGSIELDAENNQLIVKDLNGDLLNNVPLSQAGIKLEAVEDDELNTITISLKGYNDELLSTVTIPKGSSEGGGGGDPNAFTDVDFDSDSNLNFYNKDGVLVDLVNIPVFVGPSKEIGRLPLPDAFGINDIYGYDVNTNYPPDYPEVIGQITKVTIFVESTHDNIQNTTYSDLEDIRYQFKIIKVICTNYGGQVVDITSLSKAGVLVLSGLTAGDKSFSLANNDVIHFSLSETIGDTNSFVNIEWKILTSGATGNPLNYSVYLPIASESTGVTDAEVIALSDGIRYNSVTKALEWRQDTYAHNFSIQLRISGTSIKTINDIRVNLPGASPSVDLETYTIKYTINTKAYEYGTDFLTITWSPNGLSTYILGLQRISVFDW